MFTRRSFLATASATAAAAVTPAALRAETDNADIQLVYDNLQRGSRNHLRSYYRLLTQQGGSYVPQTITPAEFDAIVGSPIESGP